MILIPKCEKIKKNNDISIIAIDVVFFFKVKKEVFLADQPLQLSTTFKTDKV